MAYGFIERFEDEEVQMYLAEDMYFEAWITALRITDLSRDEIDRKIELEVYSKSSPLTEDEKWSLEMERYQLSREGHFQDD